MNDKISASESITRVMAAVSGVAKRDKNAQQGFNFRGIDAVVNAIGPVLREVGGIIVPTVIEKTYDRGATKNGTPTVEAFLTVAFDWYGTDGGAPIRGIVVSEAMDTSDKATAKAMSVALRTYLLQTLMLPTDERDPDADYHERQAANAVSDDELKAKAIAILSRLMEVADRTELDALWAEATAAGVTDQVRAQFTSKKEALA